jgi:hypothetical protein
METRQIEQQGESPIEIHEMQKPDRQLVNTEVCCKEAIREYILENRHQAPKTWLHNCPFVKV